MVPPTMKLAQPTLGKEKKEAEPVYIMVLWAFAPVVAVLHASSQAVDSNALASEPSEPEFCGALWFLHIPKTGGDSVRYFLQDAALRAHRDKSKSAYKFVDLFDWKDCEKRYRYGVMSEGPMAQTFRNASMSKWSASPMWAEAETELTQKMRPRLVVHQHHCSVGLGTALMPQLQQLDAWLRQAGHGCRVRIATVVRKPVAHLESSIYYNKVGRGDVANFIRQHSNSQAKYLLYGDKWSEYMRSKGLNGDGTLEANATSALNGVEILGTTEELPAFTARLAKLLEVPVPTLEHLHGNTTHEFELTDEDRSLMYQSTNIDRLLYQRFSTDAKADAWANREGHRLEKRPPSSEHEVERDPLRKSPY